MRRVSDGYTIIEVMIFLAVSVVIAGAAMTLISGKQAETTFNQKMRDTQSKLQDWINDVSTGTTGGDPTQQYCAPSGNRPEIVTPPPAKPANYTPQCTFLGKVIQFTDSSYGVSPDQDSKLYAFPVFGCRLTGCPASGDGTLPSSMLDADPEPAVGAAVGSNTDLKETFDLSPAYVKNVCSAAICSPVPSQATQSHLIGFMNNFNTENTTQNNGSEDLDVFLYNLKGSHAPADDQSDTTALKCIEGVAGPCQLVIPAINPPSLTSFKFCLTDGKRTAQITISSANGIGVSTRLDYVAC